MTKAKSLSSWSLHSNRERQTKPKSKYIMRLMGVSSMEKNQKEKEEGAASLGKFVHSDKGT